MSFSWIKISDIWVNVEQTSLNHGHELMSLNSSSLQIHQSDCWGNSIILRWKWVNGPESDQLWDDSSRGGRQPVSHPAPSPPPSLSHTGFPRAHSHAQSVAPGYNLKNTASQIHDQALCSFFLSYIWFLSLKILPELRGFIDSVYNPSGHHPSSHTHPLFIYPFIPNRFLSSAFSIVHPFFFFSHTSSHSPFLPPLFPHPLPFYASS